MCEACVTATCAQLHQQTDQVCLRVSQAKARRLRSDANVHTGTLFSTGDGMRKFKFGVRASVEVSQMHADLHVCLRLSLVSSSPCNS